MGSEKISLSDLELDNIVIGYGRPGKDVSVVGEKIVLGGKKFDKGIGTHSNSVILLQLDGKATRLNCFVGVNDTGGNEDGTVVFIIKAGGKTLFDSGTMTRGDKPKKVDLDITGIKRLMLIANDAGDDINSDHAMWADVTVAYEGVAPMIAKLDSSIDAGAQASGDKNALWAGATVSYEGKADRKATIINVTDFGVSPNSRKNAVRGIAAAIEACRKVDSPLLVFPKGRYDLWPQHSQEIEYYESNTTDNNPRICPIVLKGIEELTIDGNGSEFICHGIMQPLTLDHCTNVTIKNIDVDWDIPFVAQSRIIKVEDEYIDIKIDPIQTPYEIKGGKISFWGEGWKSNWWGCMEFENETRLIPQQSGDNPLGGGWDRYRAEELGDGLVRLHYNFKRKPAVGNYLIMRHSARDHSGVFIHQSKNITFKNFNLFTAAGLGFLGQFSENISLINTNVMPNYTKGRYQCGHADGFQISNCKGHILVDGCKFEGLMDDPINVHGTSIRVIKIINSKTVLCKFMHGQSTGMIWGDVGDKVGFIENSTMETIGEGNTASLKRIDRDHFEVGLVDNVPADLQEGDAMENLTWAPDFTAKNCVFGSCRARGILISTPGKVLVEGNEFISSGAAILIAGDANGWYESGAVRDVTIRGNTFDETCLSSWYQFGEGIISILPIIPQFDPEKPFHRNIRIENNSFKAFDYSILYALSVDGLTFNNNTIERSDRYKPWQNRRGMLTFAGCKDVEVKGNKISNNVLGKNIELDRTDISELTVGNDQNIVDWDD